MSVNENTFLKLQNGQLVEVLGKLSTITVGQRDVLVLISSVSLSGDRARALEAMVGRFFGNQPVMVLDPGLQVAVIQRDRLAAVGDGVVL